LPPPQKRGKGNRMGSLISVFGRDDFVNFLLVGQVDERYRFVMIGREGYLLSRAATKSDEKSAPP